MATGQYSPSDKLDNCNVTERRKQRIISQTRDKVESPCFSNANTQSKSTPLSSVHEFIRTELHTPVKPKEYTEQPLEDFKVKSLFQSQFEQKPALSNSGSYPLHKTDTTENDKLSVSSVQDDVQMNLLLSLQEQVSNLKQLVQQQDSTSSPPQGNNDVAQGQVVNSHHKQVKCSQSPHNIVRKEKDPDKFDGKSVEWKDYIIHFEQVALWNNWSEQDKAQQLAISLRGQAQKLLGDLTPSQLNDFNSLKSTLTERYDPQERGVAYKCEFRNRRRNSKESPIEFAFALRRTACLAFPDIPYEYREVNVLEQFLVGVGSQALREHIIFKHPKTVDQAIAWAVEYEAVKGSEQSPVKPSSNVESGHSNTVKHKQSPNPNADTTSTLSNNDMQQTLQKLLECMEQMTQSRQKQTKYRQNIECFNCHRKGHIAKDCRQRNISEVECFKCHNKGHYANKCPTSANLSQEN